MQSQVVSPADRHPSRGVADWLSLAAAPTFAFMALLTALPGSASLDMLCSTAPGASSFNGMVLMYLLMSAFHLTPWLRLISSRRVQRRNWAYWA